MQICLFANALLLLAVRACKKHIMHIMLNLINTVINLSLQLFLNGRPTLARRIILDQAINIKRLTQIVSFHVNLNDVPDFDST